MAEREARLVAFLCRWCSYEGADAAGRQRRAVPANLATIRVPCSGSVSPETVLQTLRAGADGVMLLACHPGDCHYGHGNLQASLRMQLLRRVLEQSGSDPRRVLFDHVSAGEGERFAELTEQFAGTVQALGPLPDSGRQVHP